MTNRLYDDSSLFSIVMPTKNRPIFLQRSLLFLENQDFSGQLLIVDGSDDPMSTENQWIIDSHTTLNIIYIHTGNLGNALTEMHQGLKNVTSKYSLMYHDDDFFFLDEIDKCIDFLENNSDYVSAKGRFVWLSQVQDKEFKFSNQPMYSFTEVVNERRLANMFDCYCHLFFSVIRREVFCHVLSHVPQYLDQGWFDQFASSLILGVRGKSHTFDGLFCIRQVHPDQHHRRIIQASPYSHFPMILASPDFSKSYQDFRKCLIDSCQNFVCIDNEQLGTILDHGLLSLLKRGFAGGTPPEHQDLEVMKQLQETGSVEQRKIRQVVSLIIK